MQDKYSACRNQQDDKKIPEVNLSTVFGCQIVVYQDGKQEQAEELVVTSVGIFQEARGEWGQEEGKDGKRVWPLCLASVGPYGAYLADGSEYRGNYGVSEETLYEFHKHRMELLWEAGADLLLLETQPSLREAPVAAKNAAEMGADYWISFSCGGDKHNNEGT